MSLREACRLLGVPCGITLQTSNWVMRDQLTSVNERYMRNAIALESWHSFYTYSCRNGTLIGGFDYVRLALDVNGPENV